MSASAPDEAHLEPITSPRLHAARRRDDAHRPRSAGAASGTMPGRIAACAAVGLVPFATLHFARGEPGPAWLHAGVLAGLAACAAYAGRGGDARLAARIAAVLVVGGGIALGAMQGAAATHWAYAAIVATALLVRPREAAAASAVLIPVMGLMPDAHATLATRVGFLVSASLVAIGVHALAWRAHRREAELDALATRDALTGAGNARALEAELRLAAESARREGRACGVAVLDVDHLAQLAERHGDDVAAQVLVDLATVVGEATRSTDRLFRTGEATFALLLPGAGIDVLGPMLDSLRLRIGDALRVEGEIVSVSVGAAALRAGEDADAWLARAQAALEHARGAGRNRVEVSDCTVTSDGRPIRGGFATRG